MALSSANVASSGASVSRRALIMAREGAALLTVRDLDKPEIIDIGRRFHDLGFKIHATVGTAMALREHGIPVHVVRRLSEARPNIGDLLDGREVNYVISTSTKGRQPGMDEVKMRRKAVESSIGLITALDTARAILDCLESGRTLAEIPLVDITEI